MRDSARASQFRQEVRFLAKDFIRNHKNRLPKNFMQLIANSAVFIQKQIIQSKSTKANAEKTIKKKGFDHPLFETGRLLQSLVAKVRQIGNNSKKVLKGYDKSIIDHIYKGIKVSR